MSSADASSLVVRAAGLLLAPVCVCGSLVAADSGWPRGTIVLIGHGETVYGVAYSPDGKVVATGSFDQSIKLWDAATGKPIRTLAGPTANQRQILTVAFSPNGRILACGGEDNAVKLWDLSRRSAARGRKPPPETPIGNLPHGNLVDVVAFDPSGNRLATGCHDGTVRIWDVAKGQLVRQIRAHVAGQPAPVYSLVWDHGGSRLISGSFDQTLKLWDVGSGELVREFRAFNGKTFPRGHLEGVLCASVSPDGKSLASGSSDRTIRIWDVASGSVIRELTNPRLRPTGPAPRQAHPGWVNGLRYTPDGKYLVSAGNAASNQGYVALWNPADGKLVRELTLSIGPIYGIALSPDGKRAALACGPADRNSSEANGYILNIADLER